MEKNRKKRKLSKGNLVVSALLVFFSLLTLYPLWHCVVGSLTTFEEYIHKPLLLWPEELTLDAYRYVFTQGRIFSPMFITVITTLIGTPINLFMQAYMAYGLAKSFPGNGLITSIVVLTMFLNPGLIPQYLLFRQLGILNTIWVYILPCMINAFYLIILRTHFASLPKELMESSRLDGCSEFGTFFRIALPLSLPVMASIGLFTAVDYWNTYSQSVYFVTDASKKTLQDYLYIFLSGNSANISGGGINRMMGNVFSENTKLANTVLSILPIIVVYPFTQRYFVKGSAGCSERIVMERGFL